MKKIIAAAAGAGLLVFAAQARSDESGPKALAPAEAPVPDLGDWTKPLGVPSPSTEQLDPAPAAEELAPTDVEVDVVDAHWMALTMWGEARSHGEEGLRAVGHVIHNRWQAKAASGAYVTDTVSQAYQFSCWSPGDPNRDAMLNVDRLPQDSHDYRQWLAAKRIAQEILSGQSEDPTGGALFYHTTGVSPKWSRGVPPVRQIGNHLFFLTAR